MATASEFVGDMGADGRMMNFAAWGLMAAHIHQAF
jgi:hypothetical protein